MLKRQGYAAGAVLVGLLAALGGCANQQDLRKAELVVLMAGLPGVYDNLQQVQADTAAGHSGAHAAQSLLILHLQAPLVGDDVLYVRETAADDPRRVTAERIWSLRVNEAGQVLASPARFNEPERWQVGLESPELFRSLLMNDLKVITGCDLLWTKTATGFSGDTLGHGCHRSGAAAAPLVQHWRLGADGLDVNDGTTTDDYYRFRRRGATE